MVEAAATGGLRMLQFTVLRIPQSGPNASPAVPTEAAREGGEARRGACSWPSGSGVVVLLEPVVERALADPEQLGGALAVAADDVERVQDRLALQLGERADLVGLGDRAGRAVLQPDVAGIDRVAVGEDRGALQRVGQLAHVAAPARALQPARRARGQPRRAALEVARDPVEQGARERQEVEPAVAQRRAR